MAIPAQSPAVSTERVRRLLDSAAAGRVWLLGLGVVNFARGHQNLLAIARSGITLDLLATVVRQLEAWLPHTSDPDMALNNLERMMTGARSPLALGAMFERDPTALPILLRIFSTSQYLSDLIIRDRESYDALRLTEGQPVSRAVLIDDLTNEMARIDDDRLAMTTLRRFRHREMLRIAYGDIICNQRIEDVTKQLSYVAEAICQAALDYAWRRTAQRFGIALHGDGSPGSMVVLALGKLGGRELNYSSDIDLVIFHEPNRAFTGPRSLLPAEIFDRVAQHFVRLLSETTQYGAAYRVDMRLRPEGARGPLTMSRAAALYYYDVKGRTWERQAFIKARAVAGDLALGARLLEELQPWIYQRHFRSESIAGVRALKRQIERRTQTAGMDHRDVKTGHGGIRDIEFAIQFLQLMHGSQVPSVRVPSTLDALERLESAGCLTTQELTILRENYVFLRTVEHRLQIMFDRQTHQLPAREHELAKLALRMGFVDTRKQSALEQFQEKLQQVTYLNRRILDHLLHHAFEPVQSEAPAASSPSFPLSASGSVDDTAASIEFDLVLDPEPSDQQIESTLSPFGFGDAAAYGHLQSLATEKIPFLSPHRCRHFLAAIAPRLLREISTTPDPDATLVALTTVSDSVGGKAVLWELFNSHPASMQLYVRLCAAAPYLAQILTSNPGMIDELLDSLILEQLPSGEFLRHTLDEMIAGATDIRPMLHSFKAAQHLRVGVRDILGRDPIRDTHRALADIAEIVLCTVADRAREPLAARLGRSPASRHSGQRSDDDSQLVILAMGKLGGREPNYHSDLDVVYLYPSSRAPVEEQTATPADQYFFSQWAAEVTRGMAVLGPHGRLYQLDCRLRPGGKSGSLAVSTDAFARYFASGEGQLWERLALCKARPVYGTPAAQQHALQLVHQAITQTPWAAGMAGELRDMRLRMQQDASPHNLKRGIGGTVDVEFSVQMLQLKFASECPQILVPGTLQAAARLREHGFLGAEQHQRLSYAYEFLRTVESGLRLMNTTARHDLPTAPEEIRRLAYLLRRDPQELTAEIEQVRRETRETFEHLFNSAAPTP